MTHQGILLSGKNTGKEKIRSMTSMNSLDNIQKATSSEKRASMSKSHSQKPRNSLE